MNPRRSPYTADPLWPDVVASATATIGPGACKPLERVQFGALHQRLTTDQGLTSWAIFRAPFRAWPGSLRRSACGDGGNFGSFRRSCHLETVHSRSPYWYIPLHPQLVELLDTLQSQRSDEHDRLIVWKDGPLNRH
jgi:hypothetical protein